jgi:hypothetical protein
MYQRRRSFLGTVAGAGLLTSFGIDSTAAAEPPTESHNARKTEDENTKNDNIVGIEVVDLESNERQLYQSISEAKNAMLPPGEYELITVVDNQGEITERSERITVGDNAAQPAVDNGIELRATVPSETVYNHFSSTGTVEVLAGAVERVNGVDSNPASDVEVSVELIGPNGDTRQVNTGKTDSNGFLRTAFALSDAPTGSYRAEVKSDETNSRSTAYFNVGPYTAAPFHWSSMTIDTETTIGFFTASSGTPQSNVERDISIEKPDGTTATTSLTFDNGGIASLSFTPEQTGEYYFEGVETQAYGERIQSVAGPKAFVPYFQIRDQYTDSTVRWGGFVVSDDQTPYANRGLIITFSNDDEAVIERTTTTNNFGQFIIEFDPDGTPDEYDINIQTQDGTEVFLFGDRIDFNRRTDDDPDSVQVDVSGEEYRISPGGSVQFEIMLSENGDPISNESIQVIEYYSYDDVPFGSAEIQTAADGTAGYTLSLPDGAPDGERVYVTAIVEYNGQIYSDTDSLSIEQITFDLETYDLQPGETNSIAVTAKELSTEEPVSGVPISLIGNRNHVDAESFDGGYTETDENGAGEISLSIPSDVTRDVLINDFTPYSDANTARGSIEEPISTDVTVDSENPSPGETLSFSYTTDTADPVSAIASFPARNGATSIIVDEGSQAELAIPADIELDDSEQLHLLLLSSNGEAAEVSEYIETGDGDPDPEPDPELFDIVIDADEEVTAGERASIELEVTANQDPVSAFQINPNEQPDHVNDFAELSVETDADTQIEDPGFVVYSEVQDQVTVAWEGQVPADATAGETFTLAGDALNEAQDRQAFSHTVTVIQNPLEKYRNDDGEIDDTGLLEAISDWRDGELNDTDLLEVISEWRDAGGNLSTISNVLSQL